MKMRTSQLHLLLPSPMFPSFQCCIPLPSIKSEFSGETAAVSCLWLPATLLPLSPTEMCNPKWEQRAPTCQPSPAFSKTQFRPDQTWNYPRLSVLSTSQLCFNTHNSCLSNQLEGQSLASNTKGNSCLSCCFWKTLFRKNTGAEPGTSEAKARNSTRQVANQYGLSLRPSGRHATYSQMGCTGTSHLPSPQFTPFTKDVRLWSNLKSF